MRLSDLVEEKESVLNRRESAVKAMTEELIKANDIIRKLQAEMRVLNTKLKTRTEVASEQEKVLKQREAEIAELREKADQATRLAEETDRLRSKNDEKDKTIQSNEQSNNYYLFLFLSTLKNEKMCSKSQITKLHQVHATLHFSNAIGVVVDLALITV